MTARKSSRTLKSSHHGTIAMVPHPMRLIPQLLRVALLLPLRSMGLCQQQPLLPEPLHATPRWNTYGSATTPLALSQWLSWRLTAQGESPGWQVHSYPLDASKAARRAAPAALQTARTTTRTTTRTTPSATARPRCQTWVGC